MFDKECLAAQDTPKMSQAIAQAVAVVNEEKS